jgi:hypothetical protein
MQQFLLLYVPCLRVCLSSIAFSWSDNAIPSTHFLHRNVGFLFSGKTLSFERTRGFEPTLWQRLPPLRTVHNKRRPPRT